MLIWPAYRACSELQEALTSHLWEMGTGGRGAAKTQARTYSVTQGLGAPKVQGDFKVFYMSASNHVSLTSSTNFVLRAEAKGATNSNK